MASHSLPSEVENQWGGFIMIMVFSDVKSFFSGGAMVKNPPANVGDVRDVGWIPGSGRSPGGGNCNPLQYSCLENTTDRSTW